MAEDPQSYKHGTQPQPGGPDLGSSSLDRFSPDESLAYLRQTLPVERASDEELASLAERLGRLPLTLLLAARCLERQPKLSASGYLGKLDDLLADPAMAGWLADLGNPATHDLDLVGTFRLSWDQVGDERARKLFLVTGNCAPNQPVPRDLLEMALQVGTARNLRHKSGGRSAGNALS